MKNLLLLVCFLSVTPTVYGYDMAIGSELEGTGASTSLNISTIQQVGTSNRASSVQGGYGNSATIAQIGQSNQASIRQNAYSNEAAILQSGGYLRANITQNGISHDANIVQKGYDKQASINQQGVSGSAAVIQLGGGHTPISVTQFSRGRASIQVIQH